MLPEPPQWVSGYRLMWLIVMFDLPVVEKADRKAATQFRNYLLDEGFSMGQFSVYYRLLSGKEATESLIKRLKKHLPEYGSVQMLSITDKQYENIHSFQGKKRHDLDTPEQLYLF